MLDAEVAKWVDRHWAAVESLGAMPGPGPMRPWAFAACCMLGYALSGSAGLHWTLSCVAGLAIGKAASESWWAFTWSMWAGRRGAGPAASRWLAGRVSMGRADRTRSLMLAKLLGANALRKSGASWLALPLESSALAGLDGLRAVLDLRAECLWGLKARFDPDRARLECHAHALALALSWGRGEMALSFASRLRRADAQAGLSLRPPSESLSRLAWRWDALGGGAHWRPIQGKASLPRDGQEAGSGVDSMSFSNAFSLACESYRDSKFEFDAHWEIASRARASYGAQLERRSLVDAMGESAPAPGLPTPHEGSRSKRL